MAGEVGGLGKQLLTFALAWIMLLSVPCGYQDQEEEELST